MHWGFVIAGYLIVFTALAAYIAWVLYRGRELSKRVPEDRRRYLDSEAAGNQSVPGGLGFGRHSQTGRDSPVDGGSPVGSDSDSGRDSGVAR